MLGNLYCLHHTKGFYVNGSAEPRLYSLELFIESLVSYFVPQDDLLSLKVGSVLHHLSIKRAIQVLRLNTYEPNCLRRRPSDEVLAAFSTD